MCFKNHPLLWQMNEIFFLNFYKFTDFYSRSTNTCCPHIWYGIQKMAKKLVSEGPVEAVQAVAQP